MLVLVLMSPFMRARKAKRAYMKTGKPFRTLVAHAGFEPAINGLEVLKVRERGATRRALKRSDCPLVQVDT